MLVVQKPGNLGEIVSKAFAAANSRFVESGSDFGFIFFKLSFKSRVGRVQRSQDEDVDFPLKLGIFEMKRITQAHKRESRVFPGSVMA